MPAVDLHEPGQERGVDGAALVVAGHRGRKHLAAVDVQHRRHQRAPGTGVLEAEDVPELVGEDPDHLDTVARVRGVHRAVGRAQSDEGVPTLADAGHAGRSPDVAVGDGQAGFARLGRAHEADAAAGGVPLGDGRGEAPVPLGRDGLGVADRVPAPCERGPARASGAGRVDRAAVDPQATWRPVLGGQGDGRRARHRQRDERQRAGNQDSCREAHEGGRVMHVPIVRHVHYRPNSPEFAL